MNRLFIIGGRLLSAYDKSTHEFREAGMGMKIDMDIYKTFAWLT